jgi:hypothetical protein
VQQAGGLSVLGQIGIKDFQKCFSRKCENDSKNLILRFMAPKIMKQILVDFLEVDLWVKNIAC